MSRGGESGRGGALRCPECGVSLAAGVKRCDFCGRKVAVDAPAEVVGPTAPGGSPLSAALDVLKALGTAVLVIGAFAYVGGDLGKREAPTLAPATAPDLMRLAQAACEGHIRKQVRSPFRVIALLPGRFSAEGGGYVVAGTVELQSVDGLLQRKRYWCRARRGEGSAVVVDDGRLY